jgi:hypothetical protein
VNYVNIMINVFYVINTINHFSPINLDCAQGSGDRFLPMSQDPLESHRHPAQQPTDLIAPEPEAAGCLGLMDSHPQIGYNTDRPYIGNDVGILEGNGRRVVVSIFTANHLGVGTILEDAIGRITEMVAAYYGGR